jgi:hypothetical protein
VGEEGGSGDLEGVKEEELGVTLGAGLKLLVAAELGGCFGQGLAGGHVISGIR